MAYSTQALARIQGLRPIGTAEEKAGVLSFVVDWMRPEDMGRYLDTQGIGTEIYYPVPLHLQDCFKHLGGKPGDLPHSEQAAKEVLALPIYPELTRHDLAYVAAVIREFYTRSSA